MLQLQFYITDLDYTINCGLFYYSIRIHHGCGFRRYHLRRTSPTTFGVRHYGVLRYPRHFQYRLYLDGKALGINERIMSCAHVRQNQKQTPQPPKVYNLKERWCSFVTLTRQRNTASISSDMVQLNRHQVYHRQAPNPSGW